jgi:hypothetical protein
MGELFNTRAEYVTMSHVERHDVWPLGLARVRASDVPFPWKRLGK